MDRQFFGDGDSRASGYVDFSLSPFQIANLLDGLAFPGPAAQQLQLYGVDGERITDPNSGDDLLYLPFINFTCLSEELRSSGFANATQQFVPVPDPRYAYFVYSW